MKKLLPILLLFSLTGKANPFPLLAYLNDHTADTTALSTFLTQKGVLDEYLVRENDQEAEKAQKALKEVEDFFSPFSAGDDNKKKEVAKKLNKKSDTRNLLQQLTKAKDQLEKSKAWIAHEYKKHFASLVDQYPDPSNSGALVNAMAKPYSGLHSLIASWLPPLSSHQEILSLKGDLSDQRNAAAKLKGIVSPLETAKAELEAKLQKAQAEKTASAGQVTDLEKEKAELEAKLQQAQAEKTASAGQVTDLETEKAELEAKLQQAQTAQTASAGQVTDLETEKAELEAKLQQAQEAQTASAGQVKNFETEKAELEAKLQQAQEAQTASAGQVATLETEKAELKDQLQQAQEAFETKVAKLEGQIKQGREAQEAFETKVAKLEGQFSEINGINEDLKKANAALTEQLRLANADTSEKEKLPEPEMDLAQMAGNLAENIGNCNEGYLRDIIPSLEQALKKAEEKLKEEVEEKCLEVERPREA